MLYEEGRARGATTLESATPFRTTLHLSPSSAPPLQLSCSDSDEPATLDSDRRIARVLERAETAKLTRKFKNRLALAAFKSSKGWQSVQLDFIESHYEKQDLERSASTASSSTRPTDAAMGPPQIKRRKTLNNVPTTNAPPPSVITPGGTSHLGEPMFDQLFSQLQQPPTPMYPTYQPVASTSALPSPHLLDQPTTNPFIPQHSQPSPPADTQRPKRRQSSLTKSPVAPSLKPTPEFLMGHSSPPRRHASPRSQNSLGRTTLHNPFSAPGPGSASAPPTVNRARTQNHLGNGRPQHAPLSSSDPNFSSFVNAATALTGLSHHRTPSGSTVFGPPPTAGSPSPFHPHHLPQSISESISHPSLMSDQQLHYSHSVSASPHDRPHVHSALSYTSPTSNSIIFRPQTPPSGRLMANGHQTLNQDENATSDTAAELMLFLAASPSPVQRKKDMGIGGIGGLGLGGDDSSGMKGRRLFSGMGGAIDETRGEGNMFGGDIFSGAGEGALEDAIVGGAGRNDSTGSLSSSTSALTNPSSTASFETDPAKSTLMLAPTTPSRDRDRARSVSGGDWGAFLNAASPVANKHVLESPGGHLGLRSLAGLTGE